MNDLERRSFYSFLGLYVFSSLAFILLTGYWYYTAQENALKNAAYYQMEHIADSVSGSIIMAHMHEKRLQYPQVPDDIHVALIDSEGNTVKGSLPIPLKPEKTGYFKNGRYNVLISDGPKEHMGIKYVIVQSDHLESALAKLRKTVLIAITLSALAIIALAWVLSRLFMRPIREKIKQTETFINDITHELNTPISALSMASDRAIKQGKCSEKMLRNISISTRQLYDIYRSLTYLNFSKDESRGKQTDLKEALEKSVEYYRPLCESKRIDMILQKAESTKVFIPPEEKAKLLFGNLIGNAIKYSSPKTTITLSIEKNCFTIEDMGIGIDPKKQKDIFKRFERGTDYSGGFGVGLSIVKKICDEYGIDIKLQSELGKGTTFELCF